MIVSIDSVEKWNQLRYCQTYKRIKYFKISIQTHFTIPFLNSWKVLANQTLSPWKKYPRSNVVLHLLLPLNNNALRTQIKDIDSSEISFGKGNASIHFLMPESCWWNLTSQLNLVTHTKQYALLQTSFKKMTRSVKVPENIQKHSQRNYTHKGHDGKTKNSWQHLRKRKEES